MCLGQFCNEDKSSQTSSSDSSTTLAIILGVVIPTAVVLIIIVAAIIIVLVVTSRLAQKKEEWHIDHEELEMGEKLGEGGFGEVYKATWKGTEVAVKVLSSKNVTKEMKSNFFDEMKVMSGLRHPNVVLFMAASSDNPMCIVMEFMSLGSLFDVSVNSKSLPFNVFTIYFYSCCTMSSSPRFHLR